MEFVLCSSDQFIGQTILKIIWDCLFETLKSMLWDILSLKICCIRKKLLKRNVLFKIGNCQENFILNKLLSKLISLFVLIQIQKGVEEETSVYSCAKLFVTNCVSEVKKKRFFYLVGGGGMGSSVKTPFLIGKFLNSSDYVLR